MSTKKTYYINLLLSAVLFLFSGLLSAYLYYRLPENGGAFFPGLIYTSCTVLLFVRLKIVPSQKALLSYYLFMNLTWLLIWILTMASSWFAFLGGLLTTGAGAVISLMLTHKFIVPIKFERVHVFLLGSLAFAITDLLYMGEGTLYDKKPLEYFWGVTDEPVNLFTEAIIFWQLIIGLRLFLALRKSQTPTPDR